MEKKTIAIILMDKVLIAFFQLV